MDEKPTRKIGNILGMSHAIYCGTGSVSEKPNGKPRVGKTTDQKWLPTDEKGDTQK